MKQHILFLLSMCMFAPHIAYGAGCSTANLTRCLDSVCAINIGANPAARCQYCGSASAGEPEKSTAMKSVTAGSAAKYTVSDKELKKAPTDPGERYVWATEKCLEKMPECDAETVSDTYDSLIEQSCKAAGISADFSRLATKVNTKKTKSACSSEINACVISNKHCQADYRKCESDSELDKVLSECSLASVGCDEFLADIRSTATSARNSAIKNADAILAKIVESYQKAREQKLNSTQQACKENSAKQKCISNVCNNNMRNKCAVGFEYEEMLANELCKFYDVACSRLK